MRNRTFFFIALLSLISFISATAVAQTDQSNMVIMGSATFSTSSKGSSNTTTLDLSPRAFYFIQNQIAVGGRLELSRISDGASFTTFGIGPDGVYFFKLDSKELLPFAGLGLIYNAVSSSYNGHSQYTRSGFTVAFHGGIAYLLRPHLALYPEAELDIGSGKAVPSTAFSVGVGIAGFVY
jgi:hypothetical protein